MSGAPQIWRPYKQTQLAPLSFAADLQCNAALTALSHKLCHAGRSRWAPAGMPPYPCGNHSFLCISTWSNIAGATCAPMPCRPLIVMMVHDPSAETPRCRLQEEDSEEYGPPIVPETAVAAAIKAMTDAHLARTGGALPSHMPWSSQTFAATAKPCMYHPYALPICVLRSAHVDPSKSPMVMAVQAQYPLSQLSCGLSTPTAPI